MDYISIKNWDSFQHYKDRNPPWVKLYHSLMSDYEYAQLDDIGKLLLLSLFMLAAKTDNKIPVDLDYIKQETKIQGEIDFNPLFEAGFVLAYRKSVASPRQRREETEKSQISPAVQAFRGATHRWPSKSWYDDIDSIVGTNPEDIGRWRELCKDWVGHGWNPVNVKGMLDAFQNGEKKKFVEFD